MASIAPPPVPVLPPRRPASWKGRCRDQRGAVMALALGFLVVLLVIAAGVHGLVLGQLRSSGVLRQELAATELAEGGVARARAWFTAAAYQMPDAGLLVAAVPVQLAANRAPLALPGNHPDTYTDATGTARSGVTKSFIAALRGQTNAVGRYDVAATLIARAPETWEVVATADVGGVRRVAGEVLMREAQPLFADALFGAQRVTLVGNASTDAYDASLGPYGGTNRVEGGSVRSNGDVSLSGNATVYGDAMPGPKHAVATTGNAKVTGSTDPAAATKTLPPATVPANAVSLGALQLKGNSTYTLKAGTYVASTLDIGGNARLIIDASAGPVALYVTGEIDVAGNGVANGSLPKDFSLVQVGGAPVSFSGNADFAGAVYAPASTLSINGNGTFYGSFAGAAIGLVGNARIHYDRSLRNIGGTPGPLRVVATWQAPGAPAVQ